MSQLASTVPPNFPKISLGSIFFIHCLQSLIALFCYNMKLLTLISSFGLVATAVAAPQFNLQKRQAAVVNSAFSSLTTAAENLGQAAKYFTNDTTQLTAAQSTLKSVLAEKVTTISTSDNLTVVEFDSYTTPLQNLQSAFDGAIEQLVNKKASIIAAAQGPAVLDTLRYTVFGLKALNGGILVRNAPSTRPTFEKLANALESSVEKGVQQFTVEVINGTVTLSPVTTAPQRHVLPRRSL